MSIPVELKVRVGPDITGKALLRVFNPARGDISGLSEGVPIEIVDEVLPPKLLAVRDASDQELITLQRMRELSIKAGLALEAFDSRRRYIAILAQGLDYNPQFVTAQFEQEGKVYTIGPSDWPYIEGDLMLVPLPAGIKPGQVNISVANRGFNRSSELVTITAEITPPK
jgi:hypothetical protein